MDYYSIIGHIIVFLVVMFFMISFRLLDKKDRKIDKARRYIEKQSAYLQETMEQRKREVENLHESIQSKEAITREMLKRVESLLQEIDDHSDDLLQLQTQLTHYHKILKELSMLTEKAEQRTKKIKDDLVNFGETETRMEELQEMILQGRKQLETVRQEIIDESQDALIQFKEEVAQELLRQKHEAEKELSPVLPLPSQEAQKPEKPQFKEPKPFPFIDPDIAVPPVQESSEAEEVHEDEDEPAEEPAVIQQEKTDTPQNAKEPYQEEQLFPDEEDDDSLYAYEDLSEDESFIDEEPEEEEPPLGKDSKKDLVKRCRDQGMNPSEIAAHLDIPRGEVEVLLELIRFTEDDQ